MLSTLASVSGRVHLVALLAVVCCFVPATTANEAAGQHKSQSNVSGAVFANASVHHEAPRRNVNASKSQKPRPESIEHIKKDLHRLQAKIDAYSIKCLTPNGNLEKMKAELKALQKQIKHLNSLEGSVEQAQPDVDDLTAEVVRLKKEVRKFGKTEMKQQQQPPATSTVGRVTYELPKARPTNHVIYELPTVPPVPALEGMVRPLETNGKDEGAPAPKDATSVSGAQADFEAAGDAEAQAEVEPAAAVAAQGEEEEEEDGSVPPPATSSGEEASSGATASSGHLDVDTEMPYGELAPFGREDTARELTEASIRESNEMVDQLERAEVAEEKRAVFRALTRLRGAAITSFDGVARAQTGNIDEYNKVHQWRVSHPLHHLASEESDVSRWAFPSSLMAAAPA